MRAEAFSARNLKYRWLNRLVTPNRGRGDIVQVIVIHGCKVYTSGTFSIFGGHHAGEADAEFIVDVDNIRVECLDQLEAAVANGRGDAVIVKPFDPGAGRWRTPSFT